MTSILALLITLFIFAYVVPAHKRRKERRYWSEKEIAKRQEYEQAERIREVNEWAKKYLEEESSV